MRPRQLVLLAVTLTLSFIATTPVHADCTTGSLAGYFDMSMETSPGFPRSFPGPCGIYAPAGYARVYIRALSIPFRKARLTIPDVPGVLVFNEYWGGAFTGSRTTGLEIDMGSCVGSFDRTSPVTIGYFDIALIDPPACAGWGTQNCQLQDCDGLWRPVYGKDHQVGTSYCSTCYWQLCYGPMAGYDPQPANGATNVPLDVVLKWKFDGRSEWMHDDSYIRISTKPDCTSGGNYSLFNKFEFAPNFLEPGRTYYWQARVGTYDFSCPDTGAQASSPVYSFTTEGVLAVEPTTWGRVKSFYRE